jgi:hypothetical protein
MKKILTLITLTILLSYGFEAAAQMSKAEAKDWDKKIKKLEPEQYKALIEENRSLKSQVTSLKTELSSVDDRIGEKDDQISQYQDQITDLRAQVANAKKAVASTPATSSGAAYVAPSGPVNPEVGVVFKVQIGAFTNKDLTKYLKASENFSGDTEDGVKKYSLGVFRDYWEADTFKKYLREMGVKDAWIVSYKDGQRVPIKDVLEGVSKG